MSEGTERHSGGGTIPLFPYYLTFKIARHIRDMYPTSVALPYQLSETYLPLLLHLLYELEQATMVGLVTRYQVCSAAQQVMTVLDTSNEGIEFLAAIARGDHYRLSPCFADGVKELLYQYVQQMVCTLGRAVINALTLRRSAGTQFGNCKMFHFL